MNHMLDPHSSDLGESALTPRAEEIVAAARELLEEQGPEALSMRHVAARLGVRAPSLYKHLPDKQAMENAIIATGLHEQGDYLLAATKGADDPLWSLCVAFRGWALAHPHLYALMTSGPLDSGPLVRSAELYAGATLRRLVNEDVTGALTLWSFAHGLVDLELKGRVPPGHDLDELWIRGIGALRRSIPADRD